MGDIEWGKGFGMMAIKTSEHFVYIKYNIFKSPLAIAYTV